MSYFTKDFITFFQDLKKNNQRDWFHAQKKRYEDSVKNPFHAFIGDLIKEIGQHEQLHIESKDAILRINRDIRFSKDKTPYNTHVTAFVSQGGRKDKSIPGLFIRLSADMVGIMAGCYGPDKTQLADIRQALMDQPKAFDKIIHKKSFVEKFGELRGDKMKRIPKEYQEAAEHNPFILHKQFYVMAELDGSLIIESDFLKTVMDYYQEVRPFNAFLRDAIQKP